MRNYIKKILLLSLLLSFASIFLLNVADAQTEVDNLAYTATKTSNELGAADGVKDNAYETAKSIPVSFVTHDNGNENPATANVYILWDSSYMYVFAEVIDAKHYAYEEGTWLEKRDAFELMIDLYHKADYWLGSYGGEYRNDFYGTGGKMCEGLYKIAAGVDQAIVDSTIQGSHWVWAANKNNGSYYSKLTETGYTVEYKIAVGQDADTYLQVGREIGLGIKIYDKFNDADDNISITTIEAKNDRQCDGPRYLSNVVLVDGENIPEAREEVILQGRDAYVANKTSEYIFADGVKDEAYDDAVAIDLVYVRQFANENVGRMKVYMLWDDDYFYFFAEIEDNTPNACPSSDVFNYNNYDSVGLCIDLLRNTEANNFDTNDYKSSVGFGSDYRGDLMCEGFWAVTRGANDLTIGTHWMCDDSTVKSASSFASTSTDTGYTVEMKLYAGINKEQFMQEGRKIGVGLNVSDQFVEGGNTSGTVTHAVLDSKNFPNNDRAWGKIWAQGPSALSEVTLNGYSNDNTFEDDNVERKEFAASRVLSDTKINIDGIMDEVYNTTSEIEINTLVSGESDASAKAWVMWTKGYLYLFIDINDSKLSQSTSNGLCDGVIVALDLLGETVAKNDKWGHDATKNGESIFVANHGQRLFNYGLGALYERHLSRVASNVKENGMGYTIEMRIEIADNINVEGNDIGLAIVVQDYGYGMIGTNTQQDQVFLYRGVLDRCKLVANDSETRSEVNDADRIDYVPTVDEPANPEVPTPEEPQTPQEPETPNDPVTPENPEDNGCSGSAVASVFGILLLGCIAILLKKSNLVKRGSK